MKTVWVLLCAFGLVCSCHKEEDVPAAVVVTEAMTPSFVGVKGVSGALGTRATDETWTLGDTVGIYMLEKSGDTFDYDLSNAWYKNRIYTVANAADVANGKLTPAAGHEMYYPVSGDPVAFVAYYPYSSDADDVDTPNTLLFDFTDQSDKEKKEAKDFVFHKGTKGYSKSDPDVALAFDHMFSKIRIIVKQGEGAPSLEDLDVKLTNMPKYAAVDLATLALLEEDDLWITLDDGGSTEATDITPWVTYDEDTQEVTVEAIVPPHTGTGNFADRKFIFTTADGTEYPYKDLGNTFTFESGKEYKFEFTLTGVLTIKADGNTNCFMVKPNTAVEFPVVRAYEQDGTLYTTGETYVDEFDVAVVWQDVTLPKPLIKKTKIVGLGNTAKVTVTVNDVPQGGNAVVKVCKKGDTTPVWSYHIWVTDPDKIETWENTNYPSGTYVFMDRNLGATEAANSLAGRGLFYQWGRKDPFPGGEGAAGYAALISFSIGTAVEMPWDLTITEECIVKTIQEPTTYYGGIEVYSWVETYANELWNINKGDGDKKTRFDPCPKGWRVPVSYRDPADSGTIQSPWKGCEVSTWGGTDESYGATWVNANGETTNFPATGYRENEVGMNWGLNTYTLLWTADQETTIYAPYAFAQQLQDGYQSFGMRYISNGASVRCVQDN